MSNPTVTVAVNKVQNLAVLFTRRVAAPILKELGRNSAASAGAGFAAGMLISWLVFGRAGRPAVCPMKPQYNARAVVCREPKDLKR